MRRILAVVSTVVLATAVIGVPALAQGELHPNVGTWITGGSTDDPANPPNLTTISADGTVQTWSSGGPGLGTWEPTGERSFRTTIVYAVTDPQAGFLGMTTVRIEGEVSEDGRSATGSYTIGFPNGPEGVFPPAGEYGPVPFSSTKMSVESMGEVVDSWPPAAPAE